ncbi:MAG: DegV family protein [Candidatus Heimdallarchaeota archaeon]
MSKTAIVTDGVNDLSEEMIKEYDIITVPMRIFFGDEEFNIWHNDKCNISIEDFTARISKSSKGSLPRTSLPKLSDRTSLPKLSEFSKAFDEALEKADSVIVVLISSGLSGTVQAVQTLIDNYYQGKDITIFDSQHTMIGTGIQALEAAKMAKQGNTKEEILGRLEAINPRVRTIMIMNDLNFLYKGGRIGRAKKLMASALNVIPVVQMKDGIIHPIGSFKGEKNLTEQLKSFCLRILEQNETNDIFLYHLNQENVTGEVYNAMIESNGNDVRVHHSTAGAILGVYAGPKTICMSYIGNFNEKWLVK